MPKIIVIGKCSHVLLGQSVVTLDVSHAVFDMLTHLSSKWLVCLTQPLFDAYKRRNALQYQHNLCIPEKYALVGYNSVADIMGSIFIRLTVVASQNCEITRNSDRI